MIRVKGNKRVDSGRLPYLKQNKMENMNISKDYPDIKDNAKNEWTVLIDNEIDTMINNSLISIISSLISVDRVDNFINIHRHINFDKFWSTFLSFYYF